MDKKTAPDANWPPIKRALWDVLTEARPNARYIDSWDLTAKMHEAALAAVVALPLRWKPKPVGDDWYADCAVGRYEVGEVHGRYVAFLRTMDGNDFRDVRLDCGGGFEECKAAAQMDCTNRVRAAIVG